MKIECHCKNVNFGSWDNTVVMIAPFDIYTMLGEKKPTNNVVIDTCIATVIGYLWHQDIETLNSCCGHNKLSSHVIVKEKSVDKMLELGYKQTKWDCANPKLTFDI